VACRPRLGRGRTHHTTHTHAPTKRREADTGIRQAMRYFWMSPIQEARPIRTAPELARPLHSRGQQGHANPMGRNEQSRGSSRRGIVQTVVAKVPRPALRGGREVARGRGHTKPHLC
jgi:hypothetical protein